MKRIVYILLTLILTLTCCFSLVACGDDEDEESAKGITVFSWEDYIDLGDDELPSLLDDFEEETGISVNYVTFANSEEMYNELEKNPKACDLLCPSEYMIMKMMREDLLRTFNTPQNYIDNCSPFIKDNFKNLKIDVKGIPTPVMAEDEQTTYACGYMWGTMGYVYDIDRFDAEELNHWSVALDPKFYDKVTIKDSLRDTYIMAVGAVYEDELMEYKAQLESEQINEETYNALLTEVFNRNNQETVDKVEDFLIDLRQNLYYFEVDNAKTDILKGRIDLYLAWSGDAVYAMDCGEEIGINLGYVVPEEGSNIWFDGFVMPKTVSDSQAELACEFLDYLSRPESAIRNMEYIGYSSVIGGDEVLAWVQENYGVESEEDPDFFETVDLSYFFGDGALVYSYDHGRQLYGLYSDTETMKRCVIMKTFDEEASERVNKMWNNVKFITLSTVWIVIILVLIVLLIAFCILLKTGGFIFIRRKISKLFYKNKTEHTVVKIEKLN